MISWIQNHLIRHGRWIFLTLLAVIIVAFVFTIGNTPGCTTDRSGYQENLFYGIDLNAPRERDVIIKKVSLSAELNGQQIRSDEQFQNQLTSRIALLHLADQLGVPAPDQDTLADYITTKNAFRGPDGQFSPSVYTSYVDRIETEYGIEQGLVVIILEEDFRINQVGKAISGPGYLLPTEALAQTQRNRTELTLSTAQLSYADYAPEIDQGETVISEYFESNKLSYEIPERIKASYILFAADQSTATAEVTDAELREHFIANRETFVAAHQAANPTPEGEEPTTVTFENVREAVAIALQGEQQLRAANEAAQAFAYTLYRDSIKRDSVAFNELLNKSGNSLTTIEPYTLAGARQRALSPDLLESAFKLGGNRYYSDAYEVEGGYGVLIYEGRIAPEIPAFEDVQAEVTANYVADEKRRLFNEHGESIQAELEAKTAEDTAFSEAAEALGLSVQSFDSFSIQDAPRELNPSALQVAQGMQAGEVSPMLNSGGTGIFVYVEKKDVPEIASDDEDLIQSAEYLARFSAYTSGAAFTNELVFEGLPEEATESEE